MFSMLNRNIIVGNFIYSKTRITYIENDKDKNCLIRVNAYILPFKRLEQYKNTQF